MTRRNMKGYTPKQGDIIWMNFDPSIGHDIQKRRPAIVISDTKYNATTGFIVISPITSTERVRSGFVSLDREHKVTGHINAIQFRTIDFTSTERQVSFIERATAKELGVTLQYIKYILNMDEILSD